MEPGESDTRNRKRVEPTAAERRSRLAAKRQERANLERDVLALRLAGRSFEQIASDLGFKVRSAVSKIYASAMARIVQAPADELRALSEARLEQLRFAHWQRALAGDVPASVMVLRIEKQLADLRGLNAPKEIDLRLEARDIAQRYGLDEEAVLEEAQRWIKENA